MPAADRTPPARVLALPAQSRSNRFVIALGEALARLNCEVAQLDWLRIGTVRADLVLLHWPNDFFRRAAWKPNLKRIARLALSKLRYRTRIVWIVHNLRPHEGDAGAGALAERLFLRLLDGMIFLSRASEAEARRLYGTPGGVRTLVTVHGRYESARAIVPPPAATDCVRLLHFGRVRPYKNIEALIDAVRGSDVRLTLAIVGYCEDPAYRAAIEARAAGEPRVMLDLRDALLSDDAIEQAIDAADGVVLPYRTVLNSGAAIHALSRGRPVLVPALGSLPELAADVGADWVATYGGEIDAAAIDRFATTIRRRDPQAMPDLSGYGWDRVTADLSGFLARLGVLRP